MAITLSNLTSNQLRQAATIREKIDDLAKQLDAILDVAPEAPTAAAPRRKKKGKLSAAGRARIRAAQRARWAKVKDAQKPGPATTKKKFTMSAAAKAAISKAAKARWALIKAADEVVTPAPAAPRPKRRFSAAARAKMAAAAEKRWAAAKATGKKCL